MELGGVCVYVGCHVDYQFGEQTDGLDCVWSNIWLFGERELSIRTSVWF
jgi:hypothetical protein